MRYIQISEPIFNDLMSAKSKLTDIQIIVESSPLPPKGRLVAAILQIIKSKRYQEDKRYE